MSGTETVQPLIEPRPEMMLAHVQHLFAGDIDGCHEGKVELAWADPRDGKLSHAGIFGVDDLDELVTQALTQNRVSGCNVYIGAALRKPDTPPFGRCKDEDFFALTAFYADLDDDVLATARERYRRAGAPPTAVCVTGRHPHTRAQLLWRQETPVRDPDLCRVQNAALARALDGDLSVTNPSRVLRLGGSIAWPVKPGRVIEVTEFHALNGDGRPRIYLDGQLAKAFPPLAPKDEQTSATLNIGAPDGVSVESCLARIRAGDHWHDNLVRLTGNWIGRGWTDTEILLAAENLTLPGWTVEQTRREVAVMIEGGRSKWNVANPEYAVGDDEPEARPPVIDPRAWADKPVPVREWLVEDWVPLNYVTALYGDGGVGKTLLAQQLLTAVATGGEWIGMPVRRCKAFGLLCEDHAEDLHINQERINAALWLTYGQLGDLRLWPSVGFDNLLMTFDGRDGAKGKLTAFFASLLQEIKSSGARFVVLDTAADLFGGNENIRTQVRQFLANACGRIAREIDGPVLLCAHPSLSGMASGDGTGGSTAWNNTVRSRLYLTRPTADEGDDADLRVLTRKKANYASAGASVTLRWMDGLLTPTDPVEAENAVSLTKARELLKEVQRRFDEGAPFSHSHNGAARYLVPFLTRQHGMSRAAAKSLLADWLNNGVVTVEVCDRKTKLVGLKVAKWL